MPTPRAESGTVEEIERFAASGRPVLLYFCDRPVNPSRIDRDQSGKLDEYQSRMRRMALLGSYADTNKLVVKLKEHLTATVERLFTARD